MGRRDGWKKERRQEREREKNEGGGRESGSKASYQVSEILAFGKWNMRIRSSRPA